MIIVSIRNSVLTFVLLMLFSGCASIESNQMTITINSEPSGALIYLDNKVLGSAPLEHVVLLSSKGKSQGYERLNVYAVWPSGARSETGANVPLNAGGDQQITFARSSNASGLNIDLSHETKIREDRAKATQDRLNAKTNGN